MASGSTTVAFLRLLGVASCFSLALAGARYIAIPIDGVDVIELSPISAPGQLSPSALPVPGDSRSNSRLPRQTAAEASAAAGYVPLAVSTLHHAETADRPGPERPSATAHIFDYVDFGAHTGPNGAFSWYADYPSHH